MLFRKNQQTKNQVEQQIPKCEALPLYDFDVPIDCFDIYLKRNNDLQINTGDTIIFDLNQVQYRIQLMQSLT